MRKLIKTCLLPLLCFLIFQSNVSADAATDSVLENLKKILPENMVIESIEETPMQGVYLVVTGTQSLYVHSAGDYIMVGDVYDATRKVSLGEERKSEKIVAALANIPDSEMILMGETQERFVTVFTDTDCYYCQQFHQTVAELQNRGLQVRYLMFPRAGLDSESYDEAVSVWCAEDQEKAMTIAKSGGIVEPLKCENPVAEQYALGQKLGVRGTPTMVLDTGKVIPGYLPPDQLFAEAGIK